MAWPNETGAAFRGKRLISYGLKGSADILGLTNDGIFMAIEVKTGHAKQSPQQIIFEKNVKKRNAIYLVARSVDDVIIFLTQRQKILSGILTV